MIKYSLGCKKGHEFESWFSSSDAYETQVKRSLVECPFCASTKVSKLLMAPSVSTSRKKDARAQAFRQAAVQQVVAETQGIGDRTTRGNPVAPPPALPGASAGAPIALLDDDQRKLREAIKELHSKVTENTVDVGEKFSEEARRIHDGDAPERAIRGQASLKQARELWEDGIPVLPLPTLPDDKN